MPKDDISVAKLAYSVNMGGFEYGCMKIANVRINIAIFEFRIERLRSCQEKKEAAAKDRFLEIGALIRANAKIVE